VGVVTVKIKFEDALKRLEEIVHKLENGIDEVEQIVSLFEEGTRLSQYCHQKLEEVENRIEELSAKINYKDIKEE
jgi:exodeoxyribonuclease VII small subunit